MQNTICGISKQLYGTNKFETIKVALTRKLHANATY